MHPSEEKMKPLPIKDTTIPASEHVPYKKQTREKWSSYKIPNEFLVYPNFRKNVGEYHAHYFN